MAKPITFGLVLEGQDALDFDEYIKNPTYTPAGIKLMEEANRRLHARKQEL
ncbi:MAG TPA: hypothetical protein O0X27_03450 [Methanocorpusculum sp.]|nr:hypothetical protein [Methanocorpusculum sp.]